MQQTPSIMERIGIQSAQLIALIVISFAIAGGVVFYEWLGLFMGIFGIAFVAFLFVAPLQGLLIWLIASPILDFYVKIPLGQGIPDITFTRITVVTIFFVMILQVVLNMRALLPRSKTENCLLIFIFLAVGSMILKPDFTQNMQVFLDGYVMPFALFFLAKNLIKNKKDVNTFYYALWVVGFYLASIGIIQYFAKINIFVPESLVVTHLERAHGPFANAVEYGGVMAMLFLAVLYIYSELSGIKKMIAFFLLIFTGGAVLLSLTRAVWLSLAVSLFVIAYYLPRYRKLMTFFFSSAIVGAISAWLVMPESDAFKERTIELGPIYSRIALYATAFNTAIKKPLLGNGFGITSFYEASRDNLVTLSFAPEHFGLGLRVPHNEFIHILVMLGIVGLIAYIGIFYSSFKKSRELYRLPVTDGFNTRKMAVFYWAVMLIFIINSFFVDLMWFSYFNSLFFVIMGMMYGVLNTSENKSTP